MSKWLKRFVVSVMLIIAIGLPSWYMAETPDITGWPGWEPYPTVQIILSDGLVGGCGVAVPRPEDLATDNYTIYSWIAEKGIFYCGK